MRGMLIACGLALAAPAAAEVVKANAAGFEVRHSVPVKAKPETVWQVLVVPARWWNPAHSFSQDAANLTLDPRPGGCFCERLPNGGGVEHLRVVYVDPGKHLRMTGLLGPMQGEGGAGALTVDLIPIAGGTTVTFRYVAGGNLTMGAEGIAPAADAMLGEQLHRLAAVAEGHTAG